MHHGRGSAPPLAPLALLDEPLEAKGAIAPHGVDTPLLPPPAPLELDDGAVGWRAPAVSQVGHPAEEKPAHLPHGAHPTKIVLDQQAALAVCLRRPDVHVARPRIIPPGFEPKAPAADEPGHPCTAWPDVPAFHDTRLAPDVDRLDIPVGARRRRARPGPGAQASWVVVGQVGRRPRRVPPAAEPSVRGRGALRSHYQVAPRHRSTQAGQKGLALRAHRTLAPARQVDAFHHGERQHLRLA
eukprot:scaffold4407_cov123-Isochrysis_galbana.AAC.2